MTPILFLDIDGVLNSAEWFARTESDALSRRPIHHMIDPEAVKRLNRLVETTGAKVVVSSSWRIVFPLADIRAALAHHGFSGELIDVTPKYLGNRGNEIQRWLEDNGRDAERFVILDDNSDMAHLERFLVLTTWGRGLQDEHVEAAIALCAPAEPTLAEDAG